MKCFSSSSPRQMQRLLPLCMLGWLVATTTGCLRYISPVNGSTADSAVEQSDSTSGRITPEQYASEVVKGDELFFAEERKQAERLKILVQSRLNASKTPEKRTYRIGSGDVLDLTVFDVPELQRRTRVRPDGVLSLPLVGDLNVAGYNEDEVADMIAERLSKFVVSPQVSLFISEYESNRVSVLGEVARPGSYPLKRGNHTLLEILSLAGGRKEGSGSFIVLVPASERLTETAALPTNDPLHGSAQSLENLPVAPEILASGIEIDLEDLTGQGDSPRVDVTLLPGDVIVVPEAGKFEIDGEVTKPGSYNISSKTSLLGSIAAAGGLTYSADVNQVQVLRNGGQGKKILKDFDLEALTKAQGGDIQLRDGDLVVVTSTTGKFVARQLVEAINRVVNLGVNRQVSN